MRLPLIGAWVVLAGCTSESWVYAPTASERVAVDAGTTEVVGEAVLTYDPAGLPDAEEIVGNALRLEAAASSPREAVALSYPDADPADVGAFAGEPGALNLHGVYQPCAEDRCEVVGPFLVTRTRSDAAVIEVSGDALLSVASIAHDTSAESDAATLELRLVR